MNKKKIILYVEDDADDRDLLQEAISEAGKEVDIQIAENGLKALHYLADCKAKAEKPCLIILDLNMPFVTGKEVFDRIKKDDFFSETPIVVFSSSEKPEDKMMFNKMGVEYITKPSDFSYLKNIAGHFIDVCCC